MLFHKHSNNYGTLAVSKIQRKYGLGFNRASDIINELERLGYVGKENGFKPRELLCEENLVWEFIEQHCLSEKNLYSEITATDGISSNLGKNNAFDDYFVYSALGNNDAFDDYFAESAMFVIRKNKASIGMIQRQYKIGFNRAYRIMNQLSEVGVVGPENGTYPRDVLMSMEEFNYFMQNEFSNFKRESQESTIDCVISNESNITSDFDNMSGTEFENFCADILGKNGFINITLTQESGDHGVDILAEKDDITYAIQCKCYSSNIGNAAVQQVYTGKSIYNRDIAVVFTNQFFTSQAVDEAKLLGVKLWDRDKLESFISRIE